MPGGLFVWKEAEDWRCCGKSCSRFRDLTLVSHRVKESVCQSGGNTTPHRAQRHRGRGGKGGLYYPEQGNEGVGEDEDIGGTFYEQTLKEVVSGSKHFSRQTSGPRSRHAFVPLLKSLSLSFSLSETIRFSLCAESASKLFFMITLTQS